MENEISNKLNERISEHLDKLSSLSPGNDEYTEVVETISTLYDLRLNEIKTYSEMENKISDEKLKNTQIQEQVKDRYFRAAIAAAEIGLPLLFYGLWMKRGFKFEETGTFTSTTFRGLFGHFRPKR